TPPTAPMIPADQLASMKADAWLVNVSRGVLVDTEALVDALTEGRMGGGAPGAPGTGPHPAPRPPRPRPPPGRSPTVALPERDDHAARRLYAGDGPPRAPVAGAGERRAL